MNPSLRDWLDAMNAIEERRITLRNLAFDIRHSRIEASLLRMFFGFIEEEWPKWKPRAPQALIRHFVKMSPPPRRVCRGQPQIPEARFCSRVMEARTLWFYHIRPEALGTTIEEDVPDDEIERVAIYGVGPGAHGNMRSEFPFAWVTKTTEVDELRRLHEADGVKPHPHFATDLRDALGLYHYIRQEHLVEVVYPEDAIRMPTAAAPPTFLEGIDLVFRSADNGDGWGKTFPLHGDRSMPEAIHEPICFSHHFKVRAVGRPTRTTISFTWRDLAGDESIVAELETLIDQIPKDDENGC